MIVIMLGESEALRLKENVFARQMRQKGHSPERKMFTNYLSWEQLGESTHCNCSVWLKTLARGMAARLDSRGTQGKDHRKLCFHHLGILRS